jgi:hypothetical protein
MLRSRSVRLGSDDTTARRGKLTTEPLVPVAFMRCRL